MKKIIALLLAAMLLVLCTACQPTPEEEYVVHRDSELIEEKLRAGSEALIGQTPESEVATSYREKVEAYKASLPQHWSDEIDAIIDLTVDADIIVTNEDSFPVYTIARAQFDTKQMEGIANNFFKEVTGIREGNRALPEEYADSISSLNERGLAIYAQENYTEMIGTPGGSYTETDHVTLLGKKNQRYIVRLADGSLGSIYFLQGNGADCVILGKGSVDSIIHSQDTVKDDGSYAGEGPIILNPSITQEQGEEMAAAFLRENGLEGFTLASAELSRNYDFLYMQEISQGWNFTFMRTFGYYTVDTSDGYELYGALNFEDDTAYSQPWKREVIRIYVSENGVENFMWEYPMEVTGLASPNAELLDLEQIQQNIKKLLAASIIPELGGTGTTAKITKLVLTVSAQQMKDERDTAYLMPVWLAIIDWYGSTGNRFSYNMFGVNALDGSRAVTHGAW